MSIKRLFRYFSPNGGVGRQRRPKKRGGRDTTACSARKLRIEQFEERQLLSINAWGIDGSGVLYDVDTATGEATNPRDTGLGADSAVGIAADPTGFLYTLTGGAAGDPNALYTIDPATGAATHVGPTGVNVSSVGGTPLDRVGADLDFDPTTGTLYGVSSAGTVDLFTIDVNTGAATVVGTIPIDASVTSMAFDAAGQLYVRADSPDELYEVDKTTGALTDTTSMTWLGAQADFGGGAIDFDLVDGTLYAADGSANIIPGENTLFTVDPATGIVAEVGPTGLADGLTGLEFISPLDFGDAPDAPYATLLPNDGARHTIVPGFFLGSGVDGEVGGQPDADAAGDDLNGIDDEDGVVFTTPVRLGLFANVTVISSAAGQLDAWVDFDGDGSWDPGDQILESEPLVAGANKLSFQVPDTATLGTTSARFRLSSAGGLSPTGWASDGEVEDYAVPIIGPQALVLELVQVVPNGDDLIEEGEVLNVAPRELVFHFNEGRTVDPSSLGGIEIVRSGSDGVIGDGDDVTVQYGWIGIGDRPNEVIARFAETLPDDLYRINLIGSGSSPLQDVSGYLFRGGLDGRLEFELDLGAQVIAVVPQPVSRVAGVLYQDRDQIVVYFNDDAMDPGLASDPRFYTLFDTNDTLATDDDTILLPETVTYDPDTNTAVLEFDDDLPEGTYRLQIGTSDESNETLATAVNVGTLFDTTGFSQVAFIGDEDGNDDVDLYRVEIVAGGANLQVDVTPDADLDPVIRLFNAAGGEETMVDAGVEGDAESLSIFLPVGTFYVGISSSDNDHYTPDDGEDNEDGTTSGSYLIEVGVDNAIDGDDDNSSFASATDLGALGSAEQRFRRQIEPQGIDLPQYPGGADEPGHRSIPAESHGAGIGTTSSGPGSIGVVAYSFPSVYGADPQGNTLYNQINEEQKDRAREIFEMYASLFGFEVYETAGSGIQVVTGDIRALEPAFPPTIGGLSKGSMVIMNAMNYGDPAKNVFGGAWMGVALHEIGHQIGLGHSYDLRSVMGAGRGAEDTYPGQVDVIHAQRIWRPDATDVDMYQFEVTEAGVLTAETIAERLYDSSLLNTALRLYREEADGSRTLIAQNDDYFSNDSCIELALEPGTYYVGVSSTGNTDYDPAISDSGFGGLTDGDYDLKLGFAIDPSSNLEDATGTALDGDNDGLPGGAHEFFFRSNTIDNTIFVDKTAITNLKQSLTASSTNVRVDDVGALNVSTGDFIIIDAEEMEVTAVDTTTNVLTVTRGTPATSHAAGAPVRLALEDGTLARPFGLISSALAAASPGDVVRIVGNGGADDDVLTVGDNRPYVIGLNSGIPLEDGSQFEIPADVVVQIDAGAILKLYSAVIDAGTSDPLISRGRGALQVLGTPECHVLFTSYANDAIGGDSNQAVTPAGSGDWGGLVFRGDSDFLDPGADPDDPGIFLNYVNQAELSFGGGSVEVGSVESTYSAIHIDTTRPTITNNLITMSADAAMSANPDAFDDSRGRIGPMIRGNTVVENTVNGIFVRVAIATESGEPIDRLSTTARFDDTDIVHVVTQSLEMVGSPGGPMEEGGRIVARPSGRLRVDPGVVVKLGRSRIEANRGNSHLIAEGTEGSPVVFTSIQDDRFGMGGTFDTSNNGSNVGPAKGDWAGLIFNANSRGSIDHAIIAYGGGSTPLADGSVNFSTIEVHHNAHVRLANSTLMDNDDLATGGNRNNRGSNDNSLIFVRQAQPIIVNNVFADNDGNVISINANALLHTFQRDTGRSTGPLDAFDQFADNHGPLVRLNRMTNNATGGMNIRAEVLTNESVWDDTDIVHVLRGEITVDQHMTYSGLRLQSALDQSLVVKLAGANAGFTADGIPLDVDDRIGGTVQIVGQPGFPVVLTSLADDSVGASFDPDGYPHFDTNNNGPSTGSPGDWRSLLFDKYSNDRNVRVVLEPEAANNDGVDVNNTPFRATFLGQLAANQKSGDENRALGFEVHGHVSGDDPGDVDVYSFTTKAGTEVWIDVDRTRGSLDTVVELVQSNGTVLARSTVGDVYHGDPNADLSGTAQPLAKFKYDGGDYYTLNHHDAGFRVVLPGTAGQLGTYYVRVRSESPDLDALPPDGGLTSGEYQLQIRLQQRDEKPGSTVRYADIRYATTGIDVRGLPAHSPLLGESDETTANNTSTAGAQSLGNLLESDRNTISFSGELTAATDIDFYRFNADYALTELGGSIQAAAGVNDGGKTWATVFDLDYADGLTRGDTTMIVFDASGTPILIGRESNVIDDQPAPGQGNDLDDLTRGTVGKLDPFIGTVQLPVGIPGSVTDYYVAVSANGRLLTDLNQFYQAAAANTDIRLEPINSVDRIIEDHIGFQGYLSTGAQVDPIFTNGLFDISSAASLTAHVRTFDLADVVLYVSQADQLTTVNPFFGEQITVVDTNLDETTGNLQGIQDVAFRSDGGFFAYRRLDSTQDSAGALVTVNSGTGALGGNSNDNILGTRFETDLSGTGTTPDATPTNFLATDTVDALTFDRTGFTSGAPTYDVYYAVRANDQANGTTSVLYKARQAGSATESTSPDYGIRGNIQPSLVYFASATFTINDGSGTTTKQVRIVAKAPGAAGDDIDLFVNQITTGSSRVIATTPSSITVGLRDTATAQTLVDVINRDTGASRLVTARLVGTGDTGEQTDALSGLVATTSGGGGTPLNGYVTGLAFSEFAGTNLYGVTSAGEFISINTGNGQATLIRDFSQAPWNIAGFQGLSLGPQNVQGGAYANTLFAITNSGQLVAFDRFGDTVNAFDTDANGSADWYIIGTEIANPTGLAFSPLDFNLWHPTTTRGTDEGHGINAPYDLSRTPSAEDRTHSDGNSTSTDSAYNQNEGQGGVSFYFGLEDYVDNNNNPYLNYEEARTQLGVLDRDFQRDLTSGSIGTNYDLPGGAYGSLITDPFDLVSSTGTQTAKDRPTLYFNYFLQTEGANTATANGAMRDSARAFISTDNGNTWTMLATNNGDGRLTGGPYRDTTGNTELPSFTSHSRFADGADPRQRIQELHDTANWRQCRVDLSDYVGGTGLVLRFDFSTAGTIVDADLSTTHPELATPVDGYGNLNRGNNSYLRGQNNAYEGFYVDDILIGWSERGEMITGASSGATSYFAVPTDPDPEAPQLIEDGPYQVEIRRGFEHAANVNETDPEISVGFTLDPNVRLIPTDNGTADLGLPGRSDNFEPPGTYINVPFMPGYDDTLPIGTDFDPSLGWIPNGDGSTSPWFVFPTILSGESSNVARSAPYHYDNDPLNIHVHVPLGDNQASTMQVTVVTGTGNVTFDYKAIVGPGDRFEVSVDGSAEHPADFTHTNQSDTGWHTGVSIPVIAGVHTFFFRYVKDGADPGGPLTTEGAMIDNVVFPAPGGMVLGDRNVERAQGAFVIEGNFVRDVLNTGIRIDAGARERRTAEGGIEDGSANSNNPTPGSPINFDTQNIERVVPSVVIENNVVAGFGNTGIYFAGDSNASGGVPAAAVPVGRIINNTIYGGNTATGIGIRVGPNASPTIVNSVIVNTVTGISIDGTSSSTVVEANLFKDNNNDGVRGNNAIPKIPGADNFAMFVDASAGNFYLADDSPAIDSSLNDLPNRSALVAVRTPLGIPLSPILAPDRDLYGQLRVDDPFQDPPVGMGLNIFKDRGAIERADSDGPTARVSDPEDNGPLDFSPADNEVIVVDQNLTQFSIKLLDTDGIGIYDNSVVPEAVTVYRTTDMAAFGPDPATWPVPLTLGSDYLFRYDSVNDVIRLVPGDGIWADDAIYTIILDNTSDGVLDLVAIRDLAGNHLSGNQNTGPFAGMTVFTIQLTGLDYGDAPDLGYPSLPGYPSLLGEAELKDTVNGGARHLVDGRHYLGSGSHWETDARQNSTASGDTFDDGVTLETALVIGDHGDITVTASTAGFLNAWIDFNDDGDWDDAGEQIFTDELLVAGPNMGLVVTVPGTVDLGGELDGLRFARFRFSTEDGLGVTGYASDGEVEDYRLRLVLYPEDFGDAPADDGFGVEWYPTLVAQDGARHYLDPAGPRLGALADAELDGQPDATATGDDDVINGDDDEDGIAFPVVFIAGQTMTIDVDMVGSPADGYLDAWIDFNQDGDWSDPDEKLVFVDDEHELIAGGVRTLEFVVPATVTSGASYARFRVSRAGGLSFDGPAPDGEVEDYLVELGHLPVPIVGGGYVINEGEDLLLDGGGSYDPDGDDPLTFAWDLNDDGVFEIAAGTNPVVQVPWATLAALGLATDGTELPIALQVDDGVGGVDIDDTGTLTINNVDPTADADGPYTINEGSDLDLNGGGSDPGGDILTYAWDLDGDGNFDDAVGENPMVPWATLAGLGLASDGTLLVITVQAADGEGGFGVAQSTLTIYNLDPTGTDADGPYAITEGEDLSLSASSSDPGGDTLTYAWDLDNDTQFDDAVGMTPTVPWATLAGLGLASDGTTLPITVRVDDGDGGFQTAASTLAIANLPPTADAGGPYVINEGDPLPLDGSGSSDPGDDSLTYRWDLDGDGNFDDAFGENPTVPWATLFGLGLASNGTVLPIALEVNDGDGGVHSAATTLTINNVDPTADPDGPYVMNEGDDLPLDGTGSSDPGWDSLTYAWDLDDDGAFDDAAGPTPTVPWATLFGLGLASDGTPLPIALEVNDGEGGVHTAASTLTINNLTPTADPDGPYVMNEGDDLPLDGSGSSDPGGDSLIYRWDLDGDGNFDDAVGENPTVSWATLFGLGLASDGTALPIALEVNDGEGGVHTAASTLTINNLTPTADPDGPYVMNEGDDLPLDGTGSSDPGGDSLTYAWDLDDDGVFDDAVGATPTVPWATLFGLGLASDGSALPIALEVNDGQGGIHTAATTLTINNLTPTADPDGPYVMNEGDDLPLNGSGSSDPGGDGLTYAWDLDNDGLFNDAVGMTPTVPWATLFGLGLASNGSALPIALEVNDGQGGVHTAATTLTINNVIPGVTADNPSVTVTEGQIAANTGTFWDVGQDDVTITVTPPIGIVTQVGTDNGTWSWSFATTDGPEDGQTVEIIATDSDGATNTVTFALTVENADPQVAANSPLVTVNEGQLATNAGVFSDVGDDVVTISASIGTVTQAGDQSGTWSWWFNTTDGPDQNQIVTITATDSDGAESTTDFTLIVNNVPPGVAPYNTSVNVNEGQMATNVGAFWDVGDDIVTVSVSASIGTVSQVGTQNGTWNWWLDTTDGPQSQTVTIKATDSDYAFTTTTFDLTVNNVAPTVDAGADQSANEAATVNFSGSFDDPGSGDTHTVTWDFGDWEGASGTLSPTHEYADDGVYTVTLTVEDDDGGVGENTMTVTVSNVAPGLTVQKPSVTVDEGQTATNTGTFSDVGDDVVTITVTPPIGIVTQVGTQFGTWSWSFDTTDGPDETQVVTITASDGEGGVTTTTFPLIVNNVPPTADAGGWYVVDEGGVVTLDASASADPGDDVLTYLWDLDADTFFGEIGAGATRGDEVGIHPTFSAAGLSGPSSVVVALRVSDELAAMTQDTATVWIAQTLGTVDFLEMNDLDPSAADLWYSVETVRQAFLTLEVLDPGATVTLYDENVSPLTAGGDQRIDHQAGAGEKYFFKLSGAASDVDLRIANLVSQVGTTVDVYGTDGPDNFEFYPTGSRSVTVNEVVYHFTDAESRSIAIHGGDADDTAELTGTIQKETAELWPDHGGLFGIGYNVTMDSVEMVTVHGGGGGDVAKLHDSDQPDAFEAWPNSATLSGPTFTQSVDEFKDIFAYADNDGIDTALLHDSPFSVDTFIGLPNYGKLNDGATFWQYAVGFEQISATATAGLGYQDVAKLTDSSGDDVFEATPDEGKLKFNGSEDNFVQAAGFTHLYGYANDGIDTASLHDSPYSKDTFIGLPNYGKLYDEGATSWQYAVGFEKISATATAGMGYQDVAKLTDSSGDDVFEATPDEGKLKFNGSEDNFVQAAGFAHVYGYANNGLDRAFLQDSPASKDTFVGLPNYSRLYDGTTYWRYARDFEQVSATATPGVGFQDVAKFVDSPGADLFEATPREGKLKFNGSEDHFVQASDFRFLWAYGTSSGIDTANLHDSPNSRDTFLASLGFAKLYGPDFWTCAKGFEQVSATATPGVGFDDVARLTDSAGDDVFEATPDEGKMKFNGSENHFAQATGFRYLWGYATNNGIDTANLHDSPNSKDTFVADPDYGKLFGPGFWTYAAGFERLSATATPGVGFDDVATLNDSPGADVFEATPDEGKLKFNGSEDDFIRAAGFRFLYGYSSSDGIDVANLHDSPNSKDTFIANPDYAKLFGPDFWMYVGGFGHVSATATPGVGFDDKATLNDSYGADTFEAGPTSAKLTFEAGGTLQANNFRFVEAVSWEGDGANDTVRLRGRPGSQDTFTGTPTYAKLEGIGFSNRATQFDTVTGIGSAGDGDVANLVGSPDGFDIFEGNAAHWLSQPYAKMYGLGYSHELLYFDKVFADAGSGTYDQAYLWDSKFDDLLEVGGDSATLSGEDIPFLFGVTSFDYVKAESTTQGDGDAVNATTGYLFDLDLEGWWENL